MIAQHNNSTIFRNPYDDEAHLVDFSHIGLDYPSTSTIQINELDNGFSVGDAIYYDIYNKKYRRALANNSIMSEVIGVVSKIINKDEFELTLRGIVETDRYNDFENGAILYLSATVTGRLTPHEPSPVTKIIGIKAENGIIVKIQRGYDIRDDAHDPYLLYTDTRLYTEQEIQDIIKIVKDDIY